MTPTTDELWDRVQVLRDRIAPGLADMDPGDLLLILHCLVRPLGSGRRFFPYQVGPGIYVP